MAAPIDFYFDFSSPLRLFRQHPQRRPGRQARAQSALAAALFRAYTVEDKDISSPETTAEVAAGAGFDREAVLAAIKSPEMRERLSRESQAAIDQGISGSPFMVADGEPFWGMDRLEQVDKWLATGGW